MQIITILKVKWSNFIIKKSLNADKSKKGDSNVVKIKKIKTCFNKVLKLSLKEFYSINVRKYQLKIRATSRILLDIIITHAKQIE